jgi:hypothetical protein
MISHVNVGLVNDNIRDMAEDYRLALEAENKSPLDTMKRVDAIERVEAGTHLPIDIQIGMHPC